MIFVIGMASAHPGFRHPRSLGGQFDTGSQPEMRPIAAILALLCDLAAWLCFPLFWDEDGYVAIGALMLSVFFAGSGAVAALLGLFVSVIRSRRKRPRPSSKLGLIALAVSVVSMAVFVATFNWIVVSAGGPPGAKAPSSCARFGGGESTLRCAGRPRDSLQIGDGR